MLLIWPLSLSRLSIRWLPLHSCSPLFAECLIECSEYDGTNSHRFPHLPREWSADGWVRTVDGSSLPAAAEAARKGGSAAAKAASEALVGVGSTDDAVLPNILTKAESALLFAGKRIKQILVATIARKQCRDLTRLWSDMVSRPPEFRAVTAPLHLKPAELKRALSLVQPRHMRKHGISETSTAWTRLKESGNLITSFGQLSPERCAQIEAFLREHIAAAHAKGPDAGGSAPTGGRRVRPACVPSSSSSSSGAGSRSASSARSSSHSAASNSSRDRGDDRGDAPPVVRDELAAFVSFIRAHPGSLYEGDRLRHQQLITAVMLSPKYTILQRASLEAFATHRYLAHAWTRTYPLCSITADGKEVYERLAGTQEVSRFRKATSPHAESHGLALLGAPRVATDSMPQPAAKPAVAKRGSNAALFAGVKKPPPPTVDAAPPPLALTTDLEKLLVETDLLNGASGMGIASALPGEAAHETALSPCFASASQHASGVPHTHICRGGVEQWSVLRLVFKPMYVPAIGAHLDLVQVQKSSALPRCPLFLSHRLLNHLTSSPLSPCLLA